MPDQMLQRQAVDIQGQIGDKIREYKKSSPLQRSPEPPAFLEEAVKHRSGRRQIHKAGRLSCQKNKEPVFCKKIQAESCHISCGENGIIAEILPVVQVQTVLHVPVIAKNRCHQKQNRPKDHHSRSHGLLCHRERNQGPNPAEAKKKDVVIPV